MADISALHLAANRCNNMFFVHEGRTYKLKHIDKKKKYWKCSKACCKGAMWRNQNVTAVITQNDRIKRCRADEHLAHKTEKKAVKKRNAEKLNPSWSSMTKKLPPSPLSHQHQDLS
ncbi:hypothetical protein T03_11838 [Trichinella britovi]|uniref:FLYWCH-type domain-containing protein n=1 Tax=Trichinella britovi TaxID=45882 RepID=A0A0V1CQN0_TRIBR|nr:hypothetical protein T03_11838 [Trichinella britovi]